MIDKLQNQFKSILKWVTTALDFFLFFRKNGRQFSSAAFFPLRFYANMPITGHWRYFWSSVALPTVLFFGAIMSKSSHDFKSPELIAELISAWIQPVFNAFLAAILMEFTVFYGVVLYLIFTLFAIVFALRRTLKRKGSSGVMHDSNRQSTGVSIASFSFVWQGLREYGKGLLYSSATMAVLFCCVIVAENIVTGIMQRSTPTASILTYWDEMSPIIGEQYAAKAHGEIDSSIQTSDENQIKKLQPFQKQLIVCSLIAAALYFILAMFITYRSWLSSAANLRNRHLNSENP